MSYRFLKSVLLSFTLLNSILAAPTQDHVTNARTGLDVLQTWYNTKTGLWNGTGWWNSANCLTVLGDLAEVDPTVTDIVIPVFNNTLVVAQDIIIAQSKIVTQNFMMETVPAPDNTQSARGFLNGYYDDEGWWALGWIQAFDVTGNQDYLDTAASIFEDMHNSTDTGCGGGIWWDKKHTYVAAIANELYLSVAAHLANRIPSQKANYLSIATTQWEWFLSTGMINSGNTINDGLNVECTSNGGRVWSYNQGVILGALVELNIAAPNSTYLPTATKIALAAIDTLTDDAGVLQDGCEPNSCGGDGPQFKGIFVRNLQVLQKAAPNDAFLSFMSVNAVSIWTKDRNTANQLSVDWAGPFVGPATASSHSSALDALVAASAFKEDLAQGIASVKRRR